MTGATILLVEDNPTARKMFRITLEAEGYRVLEASDGRSALDHLRREQPALVIQDLVLPDHDGVQLAQMIRGLPGCADLPLVVMSGFPRLLDRASSQDNCFDASLMKPVRPSELIELVRRFLPALPAPGDGFGRGKTILIVDDDPVQLKLARLRFVDAGFEVATAADSATALALARANPPSLVLCDVLMPGTDGYDLCLALRNLPALAGVPVVLVSAHYSGGRDEDLARSAGASALVTRTPLLEDALDAVRKILGELSTPVAPAAPAVDRERFTERHQARVIAQLERQAQASAGAAERAALQSAQLSMLAGVADALARSEDIDSALTDVLAACLDAGGITRGALFRVDAHDHLVLSTAMGFPGGTTGLVESLFGFPALLDQQERSLVSPHDVLPAAEACTFLERAGVAMAVLVPVMDGRDRIGALFLGTDIPEIDERDLSMFGRAIAAHMAQALALTGAFGRLRDSAHASRVLSSSLDVGTTLTSLGALATASLAQLCEIRIGDEPPIVHTAQALPPDVVEAFAELAARYPERLIVPTGAPLEPGKRSLVLPAMTDEQLRPSAADAEHFVLLSALRIGCHIVVPLVAGEHQLGTVSFARLCSIRRFRDADILAAEDLAQRAAIAIDNARLYASVRDANRAKDEFLATVSHELRSPLNAVLGWAQMLRDGLPDDQRGKALAAIERNAFAQAALIDDLLDMSRMTSGTMRLELGPVQLAPLVEAAIESLRPQLEAKPVALNVVRVASTNPLQGDASRLQQIVCNLINNAIKFTPAGGEIEIELVDGSDGVQLTVRDNGKGIDPAFLPYVFDRFKQADGSSSRTHSGLGLGLAISRHLVQLHGGTIAATSAGPGQGSAFTVTLPLSGASPVPLAPSPPPAATDRTDQLRGMAILVVDDEPDSREMMVSLLEACGASATPAASAAEARALLAQTRPHLLLSDLGMPGEDGFSLIRSVRSLPSAEGGQTPAVALSGYTSLEDRKRALAAGFQMHLCKPVSMIELLATISDLSRISSTK